MADKPVLLTDAQMQQFIRDGYLILHPDFPEGFHEKVYKRIDDAFEKNSGRNPGNNLLPRRARTARRMGSPHCPRRVFQHPRTRLLSAPAPPRSRKPARQRCAHHAQRQLAQQPILRRPKPPPPPLPLDDGDVLPQDTPREMGPTSVTPRIAIHHRPRPGRRTPLHSGTRGNRRTHPLRHPPQKRSQLHRHHAPHGQIPVHAHDGAYRTDMGSQR